MKFGDIECAEGQWAQWKKDGLELLIPYINLINDEKIKNFTRICVENVPKYFWVIPAARGKKHHPPWAKVIGGLVKHTAVATYFANELCNTFDVHPWNQDIIISAELLHDSCKMGIEDYDEYYFYLHEILPRERFKKYGENHLDEDSDAYNQIMHLIEVHMGNMKGDWSYCKKPLISKFEQIVHLGDLISSRSKCAFLWEE